MKKQIKLASFINLRLKLDWAGVKSNGENDGGQRVKRRLIKIDRKPLLKRSLERTKKLLINYQSILSFNYGSNLEVLTEKL